MRPDSRYCSCHPMRRSFPPHSHRKVFSFAPRFCDSGMRLNRLPQDKQTPEYALSYLLSAKPSKSRGGALLRAQPQDIPVTSPLRQWNRSGFPWAPEHQIRRLRERQPAVFPGNPFPLPFPAALLQVLSRSRHPSPDRSAPCSANYTTEFFSSLVGIVVRLCKLDKPNAAQSGAPA